ncbi:MULTISPECIES: DUF2913 family protein [Serratia]|uniref:DUF2913 family protein n=1 Tax=Serratia TaxID=613 RepID=UPI0035564D34
MLDKTKSVTTDNTTAALSHLAFCALAALGLARLDGIAGTPYAENLFLIRWLATAQKQKRFPRSVAVDIIWLLERSAPMGRARQRCCLNRLLDPASPQRRCRLTARPAARWDMPHRRVDTRIK